MSEWISVKDELPAFGIRVLVHRDAGAVNNPNHPGFGGFGKWQEISKLFNEKMFECDFTSTGHVTHWQPLPEPPKD